MATIGTFKKTGSNEFTGEIVTLSVQTKNVRIVPDVRASGELTRHPAGVLAAFADQQTQMFATAGESKIVWQQFLDLEILGLRAQPRPAYRRAMGLGKVEIEHGLRCVHRRAQPGRRRSSTTA